MIFIMWIISHNSDTDVFKIWFCCYCFQYTFHDMDFIILDRYSQMFLDVHKLLRFSLRSLMLQISYDPNGFSFNLIGFRRIHLFPQVLSSNLVFSIRLACLLLTLSIGIGSQMLETQWIPSISCDLIELILIFSWYS